MTFAKQNGNIANRTGNADDSELQISTQNIGVSITET